MLFKSNYLVLVFVLLSGCSTYNQNITSGLELAKQSRWAEAEETIVDVLDEEQDRLLKLLEAGALAQYQGEFARSNALLEQAEELSDSFREQDLSNRALALLTNARQQDYSAASFEVIYINFFKSLNYLALSEQAKTTKEKRKLLDAALVEARRIDLKLNEINALTPSYDDINKDEAVYEKALNWLSGFYTGGIKSEDFIYRDDAWGRYVQGLQYEVSKDYDDARIAYQQAAILYDKGYSAQYSLPKNASQRAWLDTIRMMQKAGGWTKEIPALIKEKLTPDYQELLQEYQTKTAELVVFEEQGFMPARKELNLILHASSRDYSLILEPIFVGSNQDADNASRWFSMVYADTNILNVLANYKVGGSWSVVKGLFTKRVILGRGVWRQLSNLHVDDMLNEAPIRIAVPYYDPFVATNDNASLIQRVGEAKNTLTSSTIRMTSLADIAIQEQLSKANRDIYEALIKELVRNQLAYELTKMMKDSDANLLLGLIGKLAVLASVSSDTRSWLTLPAQIRLVRQPVGTETQSFDYQVQENTFRLENVKLKDNDIKVWTIRNPN